MSKFLTEGIATGLSMASSRVGLVPEVLGDAGVYFGPLGAGVNARAPRDLIIKTRDGIKERNV